MNLGLKELRASSYLLKYRFSWGIQSEDAPGKDTSFHDPAIRKFVHRSDIPCVGAVNDSHADRV
jgi:hypothetical protein